jgi:exonuclease SbcC
MIIEEIRLKNIRSHSDSVIGLREGINLIHGDVGAGKSSILYAIEFALFGTGSRFGKNDIKLLRGDEKNGFVEVRINTTGKDYLFHRDIKNGYDKGGWIIEGEVKKDFSAVELRREALEVLKLREPRSSRSRSYIYEYAIFTPQEEMRKILEDKPEDRMKLLRKAFGLTDYANARDNAGIVIKNLEGEHKALAAQIEEMQPKREELSATQNVLEDLRKNSGLVNESIQDAKKRDVELRARISEQEKKEKELQGARMTLQGLRDERRHVLAEIDGLEKDLIRIEDVKGKIKALETDYARYGELDKIIKEEYSRKAERDSCRNRIKDLEERIKSIAEEISECEKKSSKRGEITERIEQLKKDVASSRADESWKENTAAIASVSKDISLLNERVKELEKEERGYMELSGQRTCPKCGQALTEEHVQNLIAEIQKEKKNIAHRKDELQRTKNALEIGSQEIEKERIRLREMNRELQNAVSEQSVIEREAGRISELEERRKKIEKELSETYDRFNSIVLGDISSLEAEKKILKSRYDEYIRAKGEAEREEDTRERLNSKRAGVQSLSNEEKRLEEMIKMLEPVSEELTSLRKDEIKIAGEISTLEERLKNIIERIGEAEKKITELKESIERLDKKEERLKLILDSIERLGRFAEGMSIIEKNIVNFLNQEFQGKFQELFSMLIDGGEITVEVDETFTPVIKENGMDINLSSLSGGERTSVAMAYRLALNRTVQMESTGMEESAIILDEPTDGFSTEQIERFGELLKALACSQVILVSHEQELLSCADNVIRITKENGISRVL